MIHFPDEFPMESAKFLVGYLRGQGGSLSEAVEHTCNVVMYALGQILGHEHIEPVFAAGPMDDETVASFLEKASAKDDLPGDPEIAVGFFPIPWKSLAAYLIRKFLLPVLEA